MRCTQDRGGKRAELGGRVCDVGFREERDRINPASKVSCKFRWEVAIRGDWDVMGVIEFEKSTKCWVIRGTDCRIMEGTSRTRGEVKWGNRFGKFNVVT